MVYISEKEKKKSQQKSCRSKAQSLMYKRKKLLSIDVCDLCCKLHLYCEWEVFTSIIIAFITAQAECSAWGYFLKKNTARWNKFENPNRGLLALLMVFLRVVEWRDTWSPKCFFCYRESGPEKASEQATVTQPGIQGAPPFPASLKAQVHCHVVWGLYSFPRAAVTN